MGYNYGYLTNNYGGRCIRCTHMTGSPVNLNGFDKLFKKTTAKSVLDVALDEFNASMGKLGLSTVDAAWKFFREIQEVGLGSVPEAERSRYEGSEFEVSLMMLGELAKASEYLDEDCPAFKIKTSEDHVLYIPHDTLGYLEAYLDPSSLSAAYLRADNLPLMTEEDMRDQLDVLFDLNVESTDEMRVTLLGLRVGSSTEDSLMMYMLQVFADNTLITIPLSFPAILGEALNREPDA